MGNNTVKVSVIAPAYNEVDNIVPLIDAFDNLRQKVPYRIELIVVDDGSTDGTGKRAQNIARHFGFVKVVSHRHNMGKTEAVRTGLSAAEGEYVVIFDADLQFDPDDIPPMIEKLNRGADLVAGYKVGKYQKPIVSKIYNYLGRILFRVPVRDMNAMKAMRRDVISIVPFRQDWHRYIVVWAHKKGFRLDEHPVKVRPRKYGVSKYRGIGRVFIGFFDMLSVWFQLTFARRPMLFFGMSGLVTLKLAFVLGVLALVLRYGYLIGLPFEMGFRPLLTLVAMLANLGLIMLIGGFLGEMIEEIRERVNRLEQLQNPYVSNLIRQEKNPNDRQPRLNEQDGFRVGKGKRFRKKHREQHHRDSGGAVETSQQGANRTIEVEVKEHPVNNISGVQPNEDKQPGMGEGESWGRRIRKSGRK